ncbi:MAG TPA: aminotransferase class V-fold PLP-dependent enzyme [Chloroflexota bacterium]|nr:aminotransferase class V-fold PLP-dependent enzyme [Chloroflexota bacterium]
MTETATGPLSDAEAAKYRDEFPIFDHTIYLNSCSLGPPSRRVQNALRQYAEDWSQYGAPAWWLRWLPQLEAAKERFARLIGADVDEVTISHSVSSALSSVASTFDYSDRSEVVCADLDFPTIPYQWLAKRRDGVRVRFVSSPDRIAVPEAAYQQAVGRNTAAIATSHVFYATGAIQPVRRLAEIAHDAGARIIVDGYHAVGAIPVNVKDLDVDFYIGGTLKWLLGGPGLTFIYVRRELIAELQPTISGWFASADQFAFDAEHLEWPDTADRLELGTPAVATAYAGVAGMDMIVEAEPGRIQQRIQALTDDVVRRAQRAGYGVFSPLDSTERAGIVMLEVSRPQETVAALGQRGFTVDYRPGLVRVSPHFYNTESDVAALMDALDDVQASL